MGLLTQLRFYPCSSTPTEIYRCLCAGTDLVRKINRFQLSTCLDDIASRKPKKVRVNSHRNVAAVDASHLGTVSPLLSSRLLRGVTARSNIPQGTNIIIGDTNIAVFLSSISTFIEVRRFGKSQSLKLDSFVNCLPGKVMIGLFRH